jgi:inorganic pyrophosphatase
MAIDPHFMFKPHPRHGVHIGKDAPETVTAFIEIVPTNTVKYEIDKASGYLRIDRPQLYSSICPALYGFIPQTYCAEQVAALCSERTNRDGLVGDGDPLDICVLMEKTVSHGDILLKATPIGGLRMLDGNEADDKIIAVLKGDALYGDLKDVADCPIKVTNRLRHYFLTYKDAPGAASRKAEITHIYGREEAYDVIRRSQIDYVRHYKD